MELEMGFPPRKLYGIGFYYGIGILFNLNELLNLHIIHFISEKLQTPVISDYWESGNPVNLFI